ncbi:MAG TPA: helix-turn-helix transcriptional regulator [Candidatus Scybalomonas excrementigallinarum]|nr:helix-turn-helix transcriptional regulator [Candidatus Scybalomonas excrementigallinarum]
MGKSALSLKLLDLRQQHNLTQKQLSEALHIGRTTYSYYESGTRVPDLETLLSIAKYYQISVDSLVNEITFPDLATSNSDSYTQNSDDVRILQHIKQKKIDPNYILSFNKDDIEFLINFKKLDHMNQEELKYLLNYKLRKNPKNNEH